MNKINHQKPTNPHIRTSTHLLIFFLLSAIGYYLLMFRTLRADFIGTILLFTFLFIFYYFLAKIISRSSDFPKTNQFPPLPFLAIFAGAMLLRLIAFFALPELSDDYFRFVWDGQLLAHGYNPFANLPKDISPETYAQFGLSAPLFEGLNSKQYFTIYPPVCQFVFWVSAKIGGDSIYATVLAMKLFFLAAEAGSLYFIWKLLRHLKMNTGLISVYAFNPLVIAEFSGNLHFEALMTFFLLWAIWWWATGKWVAAILPFALAVAVKLLPLMLLPLMIRRIGWIKTGITGLATAALLLLGFWPVFQSESMPLLLENLSHLGQSVKLYFETFEFNASFYRILRMLIPSSLAAQILSGIAVLGILLYSFIERKVNIQTLPKAMMWAFVFYFLAARIIHPWYVCPLVALTIFSHSRFVLIWTFLLPLTYATYRHPEAYEQLPWIIFLEYAVLFGFMIWEWLENRTQISTN